MAITRAPLLPTLPLLRATKRLPAGLVDAVFALLLDLLMPAVRNL